MSEDLKADIIKAIEVAATSPKAAKDNSIKAAPLQMKPPQILKFAEKGIKLKEPQVLNENAKVDTDN